MEPPPTEKKDDDIITIPISFGNPSNEIIHGQLRLSASSEVWFMKVKTNRAMNKSDRMRTKPLQ